MAAHRASWADRETGAQRDGGPGAGMLETGTGLRPCVASGAACSATYPEAAVLRLLLEMGVCEWYAHGSTQRDGARSRPRKRLGGTDPH